MCLFLIVFVPYINEHLVMDRRVDERKRRGSLFLRSVRDATGLFSFFQRGKICELFSIQIWIQIHLYTLVSNIFLMSA